MKTLSEVVPCLLFIQIQIQAVCLSSQIGAGHTVLACLVLLTVLPELTSLLYSFPLQPKSYAKVKQNVHFIITFPNHTPKRAVQCMQQTLFLQWYIDVFEKPFAFQFIVVHVWCIKLSVHQATNLFGLMIGCQNIGNVETPSIIKSNESVRACT